MAVEDIPAYEEKLFELLQSEYQPLMKRFEEGYYDEEDEIELKKALTQMRR